MTYDFQMNFKWQTLLMIIPSMMLAHLLNDKLEKQHRMLIEWYKYNYLSPNPGKWHLISSEKEFTTFININGKQNFNREKVLVVYFDNILKFAYHLVKLCKRACQKLHALASVYVHELSKEKTYHECIYYVTIWLLNWLCIWMCNNRIVLRQVNRIHERALQMAYGHMCIWAVIYLLKICLKRLDW